ncbi:MAG: hypothetical protein H0V49_02750 [Nocardioidaceae bacterium]|nr:hypothetical protein [Nocardioidaceae bacterium]
MSADIPPEVRERHCERIASFVRRARRVEAHSLLRDLQRFNAWAEGTTTIAPFDGVTYMTQHVPPKEAFESLASRCRPFLLQGDPIHWSAVFGSMRAFLKQDPRFGPAVEELRRSWAVAEAPDPDTGFAVVRPEEVESQAVWFSTLADSWLYGDLVHADPQSQAKASGHSLNSRYCAAVLLYGQVAIHVVATLNLIRQARDVGLLDIAEAAFSDPVTAKVPMRFPVVGFAQAEIGTSMQEMFDALDRANTAIVEPASNTGPKASNGRHGAGACAPQDGD